MKNKLSRISFRKKLVVAFVTVLALVLIFTTTTQVRLTLRALKTDAVQQQTLLTEQMAPNIARSLNTLEDQLYSTSTMYGLPNAMRGVNSVVSLSTRAEFRSAVNLMVANYLPFDFALVQTVGGQMWDTRGKLNPATSVTLVQRCKQLLKEYPQVTYGGCVWVRDEDGAVYLIRDIYSTSPIHREGKLVVRVKRQRLDALSQLENDRGYLFLYFDRNRGLIFYSGPEEESVLTTAEAFVHGGFAEGTQILEGKTYYATKKYADGWYAVCLAPTSRLYGMGWSLAEHTILQALLALLAGVACIMLLTHQLSRQMVRLTEAMDSAADGDLKRKAPVLMNDDVGQLAVHFNSMTDQISMLLKRVVQEQRLKTDAQFHFLEYKYRSLQTQISPHFIYNALETVNAMAKLDADPEISEVIQLISRYFRNITVTMNHQFISIERELASLQDYAEIHRRIHGGALTVEFVCDPAVQRAQLPTMILQPVLENALVHGIQGNTVQSVVRLTVVLEEEKWMVISIADNGCGVSSERQKKLLEPGASPSTGHGGIGLSNVKERLDLIYGGDASIRIESSGKGICVTVRLPFSTTVPIDLDELTL